MYLDEGQLIFSASDLIVFSESEFASWMDHLAATHPDASFCPDDPDPLADALARRGLEHEQAVLEQLRASNTGVIEISPFESFEMRAAKTLEAMKAGYDVIYQAALACGSFRGFADFIVRVPNIDGVQSRWGTYHYEVWDTKLSSLAKPSHVLQLCLYAQMLEAIQAVRPSHVTLVLSDRKPKRLRTDDFYYVFLATQERFLQFHQEFSHELIPDPANSASAGRWSTVAKNLLVQQDHLSQVATITRQQIKRLNDADIFTLEALATTQLTHIPKMQESVFQKLKAQANIQLTTRQSGRLAYELLNPERGGLADLPPPSDKDIFFDIEGFPLIQGGLEYLWGATYFEKGERLFRAFWAHDPNEEKACFCAFIDWVYERWTSDPTMHIYHYANYEIAACQRLMGRYGVCEEKVDELLRRGVFVDLYKVVKSGLLLGAENYSIKSVEQLYRNKRDTEVGNGGDSVVAYEAWRQAYILGDETKDPEASPILSALMAYNRDDCDSTQELTDWLRARQEELPKRETIVAELVEEVAREKSPELIEKEQLRDELLKSAQSLPAPASTITENMAWMLEFHRREHKPSWWRLFERLDATPEELLDDLDCIAKCRRTDKPAFKQTERARNWSYEYAFDINQEHKPITANYVYVLEADGKKVAVDLAESDVEAGRIILKTKEPLPDEISLIPDEFVDTKTIEMALADQVSAFSRGELGGTAIDEFLQRRPPRFMNRHQGPIVDAQNPDERLKQIVSAVEQLDNSYLAIQGPPGAGKTYTAKHIIAALVRNGQRVGISSNSHKAINNLLVGAVRHCRELGIDVSCACGKDTGPEISQHDIPIVSNSELASAVSAPCIVGSTAWAFTREEFVDRLDYLFIDEAGQVSVANLIAMSRCARNIVLMGDQMQLGQPLQGSHPAESGLSILDYLLRDTPIMPAHMGVFLSTTYRMHPAVNEYISGAIYEDALQAHPDNVHQRLIVRDNELLPIEAGILFIPVEHQGNGQASDEEVDTIDALTRSLIGREYIDKSGKKRPLTLDDILFVAPYNHQVNKLRQTLGESAKVGSVDKFQGQEAPVVFFSLCSSDASQSPRGLDFLFDKHRINVALSRAQALAIVVGNPRLLGADYTTLEQMAKANLIARLWMNYRLRG